MNTMRHSSPRPVHMTGLSLPELMVAIVVSLILMAGIIQIFASNKVTYEVTDDLSRLQENARFAMDFILRDIRMAGYFGCNDNPDARNLRLTDAADQRLWDARLSMEGLDDLRSTPGSEWSPSDAPAPAGGTIPVAVVNQADGCPAVIGDLCEGGIIGGQTISGSDGITLRYADGAGARALTTDPATTATNLTIAAQPATFLDAGLANGQFAVVSDCTSADIIPVYNTPTAAAGQPINIQAGGPPAASASLSKIYTTAGRSEISPLVARRYYVGTGAAPWAGPSLFRETISGGNNVAAVELVQGIENIQIQYGVARDTNADGVRDTTTYVDADNPGAPNLLTAADWRNIVSVRIGILARTTDEVGQGVDNTVYDLFTGESWPGDPGPACNVGVDSGCVRPVQNLRVRRRVFTTTVSARNIQ